MYRILIADDENIVRESLKYIIEQRHGENCELEFAKTGRGAIEKAETMRPDIVFMDIQMPGINGIEAMKEIRRQNSTAIFIVLTAFDKFDYAKESISVGVLEYLSKPVSRDQIEATLSKAMGIIDKRRELRTQDLTIKEKLEIVIPYVERGLIYTMIVNDESLGTVTKYKELLGISEQNVYVMVFEASQESTQNEKNLVGSGIRLEDHYDLVKEKLKDEFYCLVGPVMANKIIVIVPYESECIEYAKRTILVDRVRNMLHNLEELINADLKVGIGNVKTFEQVKESYQEAASALHIGIGSVLHAADVKIGSRQGEEYPRELEKKILEAVNQGNIDVTVDESTFFWNWMASKNQENLPRLKFLLLDLVLHAEHKVYEKVESYEERSTAQGVDYLSFLSGCRDSEELKRWFLERMSESAGRIARLMEEAQKTPVEKALVYINEKYSEDISLDEMSQILGISSYYFSKLFKSETGVNFIDYLTELRMKKAKELLIAGEISVREIGNQVGYADANYFSRIFKKNVGVSPSEYKE